MVPTDRNTEILLKIAHLEGWKVEVSKHGPHEGVRRVGHLGEVIELGAEKEVSKLCIGHENDHEHEPKGDNVWSAPEKI